MKILLENGWIDASFVTANTEGLTELREKTEALDWPELESGSGLTRDGMREFADLIHASPNAVLVWSMGITQHAFGADAVSMILNLGLSQGYVGRDKAGLVPIRGHSSVQGGAEMGAYATAFPGGKPIDSASAAELSALYGFPVPESPGLQTTEMLEAAFRGELDVLYCVGGNFLQNLPDPEHIRTALSRLPLRVHQDILVNDQMLIDGEGDVLLLPAKTRYEQDDGGVETSTERRVMFSPEIPRQVGEARAEWRILRDLAAAAWPERASLLGCETGWAIREEIARVVPFYSGIEKLKETGDSFQYGGRHLCVDGNFPTPDGKGHFATVGVPDLRREAGRFCVTTRRGKQFNSLVYAEKDPLNGAPRDAVLMNDADAARLGLRTGDSLVLVSAQGRFHGSAFPAPIALGNLQVHYPEGNVLIAGGVVDAGGGVPAYSAEVRIETGGVSKATSSDSAGLSVEEA